MKYRFKPLVVGLAFLGIIATPAFASISADALQKQIDKLQTQIRLLKVQEQATQTPKLSQHASTKNTLAMAESNIDTATGKLTGYADPAKTGEQFHRENSTTNKLLPRVPGTPVPSNVPNGSPEAYVAGQDNPDTVTQYLPIDIDVPGQSLVSSGPYLGIPMVFSGGNLIINSPNINEDVSLLTMRKTINHRLRALGRELIDDHPHLLLSGIVEAQAFYAHRSNSPMRTDVDLTSAELDGYILSPSHWVSGLIGFAYDNDRGTDEGSLNNNSRTASSRLFLNKAFIVLGNFDRSPFYSSFGQMYVPFGTYNSNMVSSPVTKLLGRTKERAIVVGFQQQSTNALYASAYLFRGDSYVSASRINNGGFNIGYRFACREKYSWDVGGGLINNLADSQGMQNNGMPPPFFGGFGATGGFGNERLIHRVHGLDLRAMFSLGKHIDLLAEYIAATTSFNFNDLSYNSHGARPQALNAEAAYTFTAWDRPSSIAIGYGKSRDALAVSLPLARYSLVFNTSIWKDTLQSLEFRHDQNYARSAYASGNGANVTSVINGSGKPDDMITAQFDLYF